MAFKDLKLPELKEIAEEYGVEVEENANKNSILAAFVEDGLSWEQYDEQHPAPEDDDEDNDLETVVVEKPAPKGAKAKAARKNQVLVRMLRDNGTYESQGYRWTRDHPFALVDEDAFEWIIENEEGFRQATPKEAGEYYS